MRSTNAARTVTLPQALFAEVEAAASEEHRPVADVLRDLVERGLEERRWTTHVRQELARAREQDLPDRAEASMDDYRRDLREKIAKGIQSLRNGDFTDGEAFMAQMDTELAELERQGR